MKREVLGKQEQKGSNKNEYKQLKKSIITYAQLMLNHTQIFADAQNVINCSIWELH